MYHQSKSGAVQFTSKSPIERDQLRAIAPSVFAPVAHDSRSAKYTYIPTLDILDRLAAHGFHPFSVMQSGARDAGKLGFTKHQIRLRHDAALVVGGRLAEVVLTNSHDGSSATLLDGGIHVCRCTNGLIASEAACGRVRVPHKGDVLGEVLDGCIEILDRLPKTMEALTLWEKITLTDGEKGAFAKAALALKYDEGEAPHEANRLLEVRRWDEAAPTLWNTFNTTQENLIRGGIGYVQRDDSGRPVARRRTREVRSVDGNSSLNKALWVLAEEMAKLKA